MTKSVQVILHADSDGPATAWVQTRQCGRWWPKKPGDDAAVLQPDDSYSVKLRSDQRVVVR
jgi:hypothetical protein